MTSRLLFMITGIGGALAVAIGAFGAHGIQGWAKDLDDGAKRIEWWDTGTEYFFWSLPLFVLLGFIADRTAKPGLVKAGTIAGLLGIVLFSGSLFLMTFTGIRMLGAVTPFGGTALIVGWVLAALAARALPKP